MSLDWKGLKKSSFKCLMKCSERLRGRMSVEVAWLCSVKCVNFVLRFGEGWGCLYACPSLSFSRKKLCSPDNWGGTGLHCFGIRGMVVVDDRLKSGRGNVGWSEPYAVVCGILEVE
eukprot:TRINITY_DN2409_c0_g1_i1.p1 TRINITY_DN2409_c0_g1~~TRINITY_DN2409_c0_g1_i1.p1  ORF type:complete len:116 (+),score=13.42 TRINITY_DN2409_c0_g1_i1:205-552(+)